LFAVVTAFFFLAFAVSRAVFLHGAPQDQTSAPSRVSQASVKEGSDVKLITELNPYMRAER
jgi:hypothetical protein